MNITNPLHPLNPINPLGLFQTAARAKARRESESKQYHSCAQQSVDTDIPVTDADLDSVDVALGTALICTVILGLIIGINLRRL